MMPSRWLFLLLLPMCIADSPFSAPLAARFSSHTAYRNVYRQRLALPSGCRPMGVSMVLRGGTAVPDVNTISQISSLLLRLRFHSAPTTRALLQSWRSPFFRDDHDRLTSEGQREADHIGARLQRLLRDLHLNHSNCDFAAGSGTRLREGAASFARNFPGKKSTRWLKAMPEQDLPLHSACGAVYTEKQSTGDEVRKFQKGEELRFRLKAFNKRHQLTPAFSIDEFVTAFRVCTDDTAADDDAKTSPWCRLFTKEDVYALEYLEDLKFYWQHSYGRATNLLPVCAIASEMLKMLENVDKSRTKGQFFFTDGDSFLSLLSLLRVARSKGPLRASYFEYVASRPFRSSLLVPFSANLALILLKCKDDVPVILPILNENRRPWANCSEAGLCSLERVMRFLAPCAPSGNALCLSSRNSAQSLGLGQVSLFPFSLLALQKFLKFLF